MDRSHDFYLIKQKFWKLGGGDIYDQKGNTIGKMTRKLLSLRKEISISESNGSQVLKVTRKIASVRKSYDIKDSQDNLLGRTQKKILSLLHPQMWMEDINGDKILIAKGSFAGWNFDVRDVQDRKIAEVSKTNRWKDLVLGGALPDTYALHILDPIYDRKVLLGFVIAVDNSVHDK